MTDWLKYICVFCQKSHDEPHSGSDWFWYNLLWLCIFFCAPIHERPTKDLIKYMDCRQRGCSVFKDIDMRSFLIQRESFIPSVMMLRISIQTWPLITFIMIGITLKDSKWLCTKGRYVYYHFLLLLYWYMFVYWILKIHF